MVEITKEMIERGINTGAISLEPERPETFGGNSTDWGVVAVIGEYYFFFAGSEAECPYAEYLKNVPMSDIIDEIYTTLKDFSENEDTKDEYMYYYYTLKMKFDDKVEW